ncbi:uncharacterized protein LOC132080656 [Ammospiza nelsoni]|uniref:uncharacterized protein LOC132080656 n=1 Tax=Ammospiza nelsoni TaxID=2857394 RepID=UPI0028698EE0|nr:uncharacterized protein LOC132080656 [Ammospiza nelsoni]
MWDRETDKSPGIPTTPPPSYLPKPVPAPPTLQAFRSRSPSTNRLRGGPVLQRITNITPQLHGWASTEPALAALCVTSAMSPLSPPAGGGSDPHTRHGPNGLASLLRGLRGSQRPHPLQEPAAGTTAAPHRAIPAPLRCPPSLAASSPHPPLLPFKPGSAAPPKSREILPSPLRPRLPLRPALRGPVRAGPARGSRSAPVLKPLFAVTPLAPHGDPQLPVPEGTDGTSSRSAEPVPHSCAASPSKLHGRFLFQIFIPSNAEAVPRLRGLQRHLAAIPRHCSCRFPSREPSTGTKY